MSNHVGIKWTLCVGAALAMHFNSALAEDDFPIEGAYTQNEACRGDGSKQEFLRVKIQTS
jgi:hypothetical protein